MELVLGLSHDGNSMDIPCYLQDESQIVTCMYMQSPDDLNDCEIYKAHCPFAQHFEEPSTDQPLRQFDEAERCLAMLSRLGARCCKLIHMAFMDIYILSMILFCCGIFTISNINYI